MSKVSPNILMHTLLQSKSMALHVPNHWHPINIVFKSVQGEFFQSLKK